MDCVACETVGRGVNEGRFLGIEDAMEISIGTWEQLSPSARQAMRWAVAAAALREGVPPTGNGPPVDPFDLLIGTLLAQPDGDGEARVLLDHFGLTARDVLSPNYPAVSATELQRRADQMPPSGMPPLSPGAETVLRHIDPSMSGPVRLYHVLGALLQAQTELRTPLMAALAATGDTIDAVAETYDRWAKTDPGEGDVAGQSLRDWLHRNNPRHPVDLPTYASDRIDPGHDLIGITVEADAFAYLLASRDLQPPLAIGLFGDWGSGKSFLMRAIHNRIDTLGRLVADRTQDQAPVWKQITQIEFNAWEYVQGDLWAGLLERIFRELGTASLPTSLVATARGPLEDEFHTEVRNADELADQIAMLEKVKQVKVAELSTAQETAERARVDAPQRAKTLLAGREQRVIRDGLIEVLGEQRLQVIGREGSELLDALSDAKTELRRGSSLLGPYWRRPWRILLITLAAAMVPLTAYLLADVVEAPPLVSLLGGLTAAVPVVTSAVRAATGWTNRRLAEFEKAEIEIREVIQRDVADKEEKVAEAERSLNQTRQNLAAHHARREEILQRVTALQKRIDELTPARVFVEFADKRSSDYRRQLGLLSTVRRDLTAVQDQLHENNRRLLDSASNGDASMPNRIVLYIDDLDRCPPNKVVEVLEAVHLLLAFEMFVVVVAVDTRWLSSALTEQLHALVENEDDAGRPTPHDYMEKIFQLPYWVQPLTLGARSQLIRGLLAASVRAPETGQVKGSPDDGLHVGKAEAETIKLMLERPGSALRLETSQLALTPEDLTFVESLSPLVGDTPRRVKRFVNTCQLLLAMRPPLVSEGQLPPERHIVCMLAAINAGSPTVADEVFAAAEAARRATDGSRILGTVGPAAAEWKPLRQWLEQHPLWKALPLYRLGLRLDMVKRLRFHAPARINRL
ncbi:P-loop NTPase fold protein [Micromonospora chersina]|uniref:P-loop NTPase fold protein n=1 Tax=Micromonospora chersina TaxID=47854 RepID=UPI003711D523